MSHIVQDMIDGYRDRWRDDPDMLRVLNKLQRQVPRALAFLKHPGVNPTNSTGERALHRIVTSKKTIGWTNGGLPAVGCFGDFAACIPPWGRHDKSVHEGVARLVQSPCEFIRSFSQ